MGLRDKFKKKDPTEAELRDHLQKRGITTKGPAGREEKFGAFKQYAQEKAYAKPGLAPVNPYASMGGNGGSGNPYANGGAADDASNGAGPSSNGAGSSPYGQQGSPYSQRSGVSDPYARPTQSSDPYRRAPAAGVSTGARSNGASARGNGRGSSLNANGGVPDPYATRTSTRATVGDTESLDLNVIPSNQIFQTRKPFKKEAYNGTETLDLNELPEEEDLNVEIDEYLPQEQEVNSEDEEIEAIKQDIRFVKQESLASTRNTLRLAQEADASGTNTLGILGSQSERLYNAEQNLQLADTQTNLAEEKIKQVQRLNRSIFIPATGNPFNKKSRLRMQEQKIKAEKAQEKYLRDSNRKNMYESEQRIKSGITQNATNSELHQKYQGERDLAAARRYQFENDAEDDEVEKELASNLDQIALYAKKLKNTATTMNSEVDSQNNRLTKIEDDADRLDINVHMNNTRLSNIR